MGPNSVTVSRIEPVYVYSNIYLMPISSHPPLYSMWLIDTGILSKKVICLLVMYYSTADYHKAKTFSNCGNSFIRYTNFTLKLSLCCDMYFSVQYAAYFSLNLLGMCSFSNTLFSFLRHYSTVVASSTMFDFKPLTQFSQPTMTFCTVYHYPANIYIAAVCVLCEL
jgi:hypothetical protein